ncbi:inositol monophosphatase family protein [Kurthia sibirica]|uniref:inositol-phosphate phosphatase n=1 Tax=Kurthia sibirica TaxID=202750 RepID=A0A2U3AQF8_9BACL|nr:inositol monophosphatase family protein [Kurthia sibirica]PWI26781.1 inositol monophosphatase [Kurthia sibirica]GEK32685.1 inositol-1-monophosphatase [Kurthia sibirica]
MDIISLHNYTRDIIQQAASKIRASFQQTMQIETKADVNDLVTNIDKETEQFIIEKIRQFDSSHRIFGEEGMSAETFENLDGIVWIVDPIDGTMNFIRQQRNFTISIGIYENGIGKLGYIYDVVRDELYYAIEGQGAYVNDERLSPLENLPLDEAIIGINASWVVENKRINYKKTGQLVRKVRGTRSYGSATIEAMLVATGRLDAYMSMRLSPWDIAASAIIAKEVGACFTTLKGQPINLLTQDTFIIANKSIQQEILDDYIELYD